MIFFSMTSGDLDLWGTVTKLFIRIPGCVLYVLAKNESDPFISLGGISKQTNRMTYRRFSRNMKIDILKTANEGDKPWIV